jgi:hypothetical protein
VNSAILRKANTSASALATLVQSPDSLTALDYRCSILAPVHCGNSVLGPINKQCPEYSSTSTIRASPILWESGSA